MYILLRCLSNLSRLLLRRSEALHTARTHRWRHSGARSYRSRSISGQHWHRTRSLRECCRTTHPFVLLPRTSVRVSRRRMTAIDKRTKKREERERRKEKQRNKVRRIAETCIIIWGLLLLPIDVSFLGCSKYFFFWDHIAVVQSSLRKTGLKKKKEEEGGGGSSSSGGGGSHFWWRRDVRVGWGRWLWWRGRRWCCFWRWMTEGQQFQYFII